MKAASLRPACYPQSTISRSATTPHTPCHPVASNHSLLIPVLILGQRAAVLLLIDGQVLSLHVRDALLLLDDDVTGSPVAGDAGPDHVEDVSDDQAHRADGHASGDADEHGDDEAAQGTAHHAGEATHAVLAVVAMMAVMLAVVSLAGPVVAGPVLVLAVVVRSVVLAIVVVRRGRRCLGQIIGVLLHLHGRRCLGQIISVLLHLHGGLNGAGALRTTVAELVRTAADWRADLVHACAAQLSVAVGAERGETADGGGAEGGQLGGDLGAGSAEDRRAFGFVETLHGRCERDLADVGLVDEC